MNQTGCSAAESYALRVIGDSMEPEFNDGHIIIVDPGMPAADGAFVVVDYDGDTTLRQIKIDGTRRHLEPLNENYESVEITGPCHIRGVVIQRATPGRRRESKHYC